MDRSIRKTVIILTLTVFVCSAEQRQELFAQGNSAYKKYQWREALACYEAIDNKESVVWYNMGNCFYKIGDTLKAIVCWKRAQHDVSFTGQSVVAKNLAVAYKKLGYKTEDSFSMRSKQWAQSFSLFPLQLLFLFCWYVGWGIWFAGIRYRPFWWYGFLMSLCLLALLVGYMLLTHYYVQTGVTLMVTKEETPLFAGPNERYHQVGTAHWCDELWVEAQRLGWYKVTQGDRYGWISSAAIELI